MDNINENKDLSMKEKVDNIYEQLKPVEKKGKIKMLRLPRKAKVSKSKRKKGWCGVLFLNENKNISGQKVKLEGGTFDTKDKNIHYTDGHEIIWWNAKYPIMFQRYDKANPTNLFPKEGDVNEIYGQNLIKLRIKRDIISDKKKMNIGTILIIGAILVGGYFLIKMFFPKLFGG